MTAHSRSPRGALPRLRPLAVCLASALFVQVGVLGAAVPSQSAPRGGLAVLNCDDSGAGSLRDVVASAVSGDVVDLTGLTCNAITLTSGAIVIGAGVADLTLNGAGATALGISGNNASRVIEHQGTGTLTLSGLALVQGLATDNGGCIVASGNLALTGVTVAQCAAGTAEAAGTSGGGAFVTGNATLVDTQFTTNAVNGNLRVRGGALAVGGTLTATTSLFAGNSAHSHSVTGGSAFDNIVEGGAIFALGSTHLTDSTVTGNTATSDSYEVFGGGMAIGSHPDDVYAPLDILRGTVSGNTVVSGCDVCAPQGGGIAVTGGTRLRRTQLNDNSVGSTNHYGGAGGMRVFNAASVEIIQSTISGNHADSAGGGLIGSSYGVVSIDGSSVTANFAGNQGGTNEGGGGILCIACSVQLSSSAVTGNIAEANGGGIGISYGESAPAPLSIIDSTISGNSASEGGGVMLDGGNAQLGNSTIAFNTATTRGAGFSASEYSYQIDLQSTIVSNNTTGTDAADVWAFPDTVTGANNLVPHASGPAQMPADTITTDPLLQPLALNGATTMTHALGAGSPAIDTGNNTIGLIFDQRGEPYLRELGSAPDVGAFETDPSAASDVIFQSGFDEGA
jgi:hypothetical protein